MANNTIFFPAFFCRINARVDIAFKSNFKKTRIFEQSRSFIEGQLQERKENGEIVAAFGSFSKIIKNHYLGVRVLKKNDRKSSFFRSGFHQIILKSPQKKTAMTFETDVHLGAGV